MRNQGERDLVEATFREHVRIDLRVVDAADRFLTRLEASPTRQEKRRIIGHEFIEVFKRSRQDGSTTPASSPRAPSIPT